MQFDWCCIEAEHEQCGLWFVWQSISDGITARETEKSNLWKASVEIAESKRRGRRRSSQNLGIAEKVSKMEQKWGGLLSALAKQKHNVGVMLQRTMAVNENLDDAEARLNRGEKEMNTVGVAQLLPQLVDKQMARLKVHHGH